MLGNKITKRQKDLLGIIYNYIKNIGYPPTFEEMRESLGVISNQSILDHLKKLEENGIIKHAKGMARSLAILPAGYKILGEPPLVAFLGVTSAGSPIESIEISGEWQQLSDEVKRLKNNIFLLSISGDSMINAGIDDGDVVLVKEEKEFVSGDVVLAQMDEGSTVKRFVSDDKPPYVYLKPENPNYKNILFSDDVRLTGKVISVLKNGYWKPIK
ncbi:transcriptional repressor LexA [Patescibacteria group bacterium]|nr:transcriptional repressor LexA [Patescibacteria group bacterium]